MSQSCGLVAGEGGSLPDKLQDYVTSLVGIIVLCLSLGKGYFIRDRSVSVTQNKVNNQHFLKLTNYIKTPVFIFKRFRQL